MNEITKRTIADYKNYLIEEEKCHVSPRRRYVPQTWGMHSKTIFTVILT